MGRGQVGRFGFFRSHQDSVEGIPAHIGPMLHVPGLSHVLSMLWLAWTAWRLSRRSGQQVHLFYNQLTFYLPALLVLRAMQKPTAVDIEDGPITTIALADSLAQARFGSNVAPARFARFISHGAILANSKLGDGTPLRPVMTYFGAIQGGAHRSISDDPVVKIVMSGTLESATGADMLIEALTIVDKVDLGRNIVVTVTGAGSGEARLRDAAQIFHQVRLDVLGRVDRDRYDMIMGKTDIGLSLKLLNLSYSDTTFPSKTLEYAENGLLLISTDISDVRAVFGNTAWYLTANDPRQLADLLLKAAADPAAARAHGLRGQQLVNDQFSFEKAGTGLRDFFFGAPA